MDFCTTDIVGVGVAHWLWKSGPPFIHKPKCGFRSKFSFEDLGCKIYHSNCDESAVLPRAAASLWCYRERLRSRIILQTNCAVQREEKLSFWKKSPCVLAVIYYLKPNHKKSCWKHGSLHVQLNILSSPISNLSWSICHDAALLYLETSKDTGLNCFNIEWVSL